MKEKELKNIATKLAKLERKVQTGDKDTRNKAEKEIMKISSGIANLEDLLLIDELVMELLSSEKV